MKARASRWAVAAALALAVGSSTHAAAPSAKWHPGHYVFINTAAINPKEHLLEHFRGVQKCYGWSALEPAEGRYEFSAVRQDLAVLKKRGKYLVLQVQYKAFGKGRCLVPDYVRGPNF